MTTHGKTGTVEFRVWRQMKDRCLNPNAQSFADYGRRGIGVCDRWLSFACFLEDMGARPGPGYTIERLDNHKGYEPGNCRWATRKEQARNRRSNRVIKFFGEEVTVTELAERASIEPERFRQRLDADWSLGRALSTRLAIVT